MANNFRNKIFNCSDHKRSSNVKFNFLGGARQGRAGTFFFHFSPHHQPSTWSYKTSFALRTIKSLRSYTVLIQAFISYYNTKKKCIYNYSYGPLILKLFASDRLRSIYKINFAANNDRTGKSGGYRCRRCFIQNWARYRLLLVF